MIASRLLSLSRWLSVLLCSGALLPISAGAKQDPLFTLGVLTDRPQSELEATWLPEYLRAMGAGLDLLLHAGGIRQENEPCHDALYMRREERFQHSPVPLLYTPAALDWAQCDEVRHYPYQKTERLGFLRQTFFSRSQSLGQRAVAVHRQSQSKRFRLYVENQRLMLKQVVVLTLNLPENSNNFSYAAGRNGEFEERDQANRYWLEAGFEAARSKKAVWLVVMASADIDFAAALADTRNPYHAQVQSLTEQLSTHSTPVLWISRSTRLDAPLLEQPLPHSQFWRARSQVSLDPGVWTRIQLRPDAPYVSAEYTGLK